MKHHWVRTRYPGIWKYAGVNVENYRIDFYAGGKRHREVVEGGITEAREELEKRRRAGRQGTHVPQATKKRYTVGDLIERCREDKGDSLHFKVIEDYFKGQKLIGLSASDLLKFKRDREAVPRKDGQPRSNASANREIERLSYVLNRARRIYKMIEVNPFEDLKKSEVLREEPKRERVLKPRELDEIFNHCHPGLQNVVMGLLLTGLRVRDLLCLRWEDVDWQEQALHFREKKKRGKKGVKPLTEDLAALLKRIGPKDEGFIFLWRGGVPLKHPPAKAFKKAIKAAGVKDLTLRDMRRSSATALLKSGASLPAIQKHLGHTKIATTTIYLHLDDDALKKEVSKLDGYYGHKTVTNDQKESHPISEVAGNA